MARNKYCFLKTFSIFKAFSILILSFAMSAIVTSASFAASTAVSKTDQEVEVLPVNKAFTLSAVEAKEKNQALLTIKIAPGHVLYREHLKLKTLDNQPFADNQPVLPAGVSKKDEILGETHEVFQEDLHVTVPLSKKGQDKGFIVEYRGCAVGGFCYQPQMKQILFLDNGEVKINDMKSPVIAGSTDKEDDGNLPDFLREEIREENRNASTTNANASTTKASDISDSDEIAGYFNQKSIPLTLLAFLSVGVLLAFTPCVLPMVPILANILVGSGHGNKPPTKMRCMTLATLYVLSVAFCYAGAGLAAGLLGSRLQTYLQQPQFLMCLGFLLLLFALNQFNFVHFQFPRIFSGVFSKFEGKHKQGSAIGAIVMGCISALMASPCVTPALVGALTYIGQTGNAMLGGAALFCLALGMGLPMLVAATIGSHLLPKAGKWMSYVKGVTGVLLLVLCGSIFMRAMPSASSASPVMAANASNSSATSANASEIELSSSQFTTIQSPSELSKALSKAKASNQHVILDVYADWCVSCRQMDKEIFENEQVLENLKDVALLRLDLTTPSAGRDALQKELDIIGPPMVLFFGPDGKEARSFRMAGKPKSNSFIERVHKFVNAAVDVNSATVNSTKEVKAAN